LHPAFPSAGPIRGEGPAGERLVYKKSKAPCPFIEASAAKEAEKMNVYAIVTDKIIKLLEQDVIPWRAARGPPLGCRATS
jgi:hypothetical protein